MLLGATRRGRAAAFAVFTILSRRTDAQTSTPSPAPPAAGQVASSPAPEPTPAPDRLRLDIDRLVKERMEKDGRDLPRFETQVEVVGQSPQAAIDRLFEGVRGDCRPGGAPPGGGAPTHVEMRQARWHPSPSADFVTLLMLLGKTIKDGRRGEDKYFLYRVSAKGDVSYLLREGRVPDALLYARAGTTYELISAYADTKNGAKALRRMERGFGTPEGSSAPPVADWQISTCPPR